MAQLNPALQAFTNSISGEKVWAQVLIERSAEGFRARHITDRSRPLDSLREVTPVELRKIATFNAAGQFRPQRAAPDLVSGWICHCRGPEELWRALQELYPGSIPDWFAAEGPEPPLTHYREFTKRQSGMYRITQLLTDAQAAQVISASCHPDFCLKRRLWSVEGLSPDDAGSKSSIPCLEPCAMLLELARKAARIEQEPKASVQLSRSELQSLITAARFLLESQTSVAGRIGDLASPLNPRRLQLLLEKIGGEVEPSVEREEE